MLVIVVLYEQLVKVGEGTGVGRDQQDVEQRRRGGGISKYLEPKK
jgi:hypothetical protein